MGMGEGARISGGSQLFIELARERKGFGGL